MNDTQALCDLYGAGGHAQVVTDVLRDQGIRVRRMFADNSCNQHSGSANVQWGIRRAGPEGFPWLDLPLVMAVGNNRERAELVDLLETKCATFRQAVHSSAIIAPSACVGVGSVVLHGAIVQANARVGCHVLINTAASVDHDCVVEDFAHVSPRASLCGHVSVGEGTHIGAGAVLIPGVRVGRWCTVGAGAVVIRDLPDHVTAVGNPARILPDRRGEPPHRAADGNDLRHLREESVP